MLRSAHPHSTGVVLTRRNRPYLFFSPLISAVEKSKENIEITYVLIPTPNRKVVEEYGLSYDSSGAAAATFIIDTKGHVRFKRVDAPRCKPGRTSVSSIIKELQNIL